MANDKKNGVTDRPNHPGSIAMEDEQLTLWLNRLWARNEPPERLEVWQMFGRNKAIRGEQIYHEDFKPGDKLDIEQANRLASDIIMTAQNDCDSTRREAWYQIAIIDRNRKASPLVRRLGPLQPKRSYALAKPGDFDDDDGDDGMENARSLDLRFVKEGLEQSRWDKQRYDRVMGEMLILQNNIIERQQAQVDRLMTSHFTFFQQLQEAQDRALDRELLRKREDFKLGLWKDGMRTARNLLPGLFGGTETGKPTDTNRPSGGGSGGGNSGGTNGANAPQPPQDFGPSDERTLCDNFLTDIEEDEKLMIALFGEFEEVEGKWVQTKPGIFSFKQFTILVGVRDGRLSPNILDTLMPNSGNEDAINMDQVKKAQDAGVTDGIAMALIELVGLRQRKAEAEEKEDEASADEEK